MSPTLAITLVTAAALTAAPRATRNTKLLIIPPPSTILPTPTTVSFAGLIIPIASTQGPKAVSKTPIIIVLDYDGTSPENHGCLEAEAASIPNAIVYVIDVLGRANIIPKFRTLDAPRLATPTNKPPCRPVLYRTFSKVQPSSSLDLGGILAHVPRDRCPCRLFWISENFKGLAGAFDTILLRTSLTSYDERDQTSVPGDNFADEVAAKSITIFPLVLPTNRKNTTTSLNLRSARMLSNATGGFTYIAEAPPGLNLPSLIRQTETGYLIEFPAPLANRRWFDGRPHVLSIPGSKFRCPLAVPPLRTNGQAVSTPPTDAPALRTLKANQLRITSTCPTPGEINIHIPLSVWNQPASTLSIVRQELNQMTYRTNLPRPQSTTELPLCIPVRDPKATSSFTLFVSDYAANYYDAINVTVIPNKP